MADLISLYPNSEIARENIAKKNAETFAHAKANADRIGLPDKIKRDEEYLNFRNQIRGQKQNEFRYNKTFEVLWEFVPLLTTNRPTIDFTARDPWTVPRVEVINQYKNYVLENAQYDMYYKLAIIDACKFGTGYLLMCVDDKNQLRLEVPTIANTYLGDYTEVDIWKQPSIQRPTFWTIDDALRRCPHLEGRIAPKDGAEEMTMMDKVFAYWKDLTMSSDDGGKQSTLNDEIKKQWHLGKVIALETMTMHGNKVYRCYDINGMWAEDGYPGWEHYPYTQYQMYPQNLHALGMGLTDLTSSHSDAMTQYVQNMLRYLNTISRGLYLVSKGMGISVAKVKEMLRDGNQVFEVPDRYMQGARASLQPIQPPAMPAGVIEASTFINSLSDRQLRSGPMLNAVPGASQSPADRAMMQSQSGAAHIKFMGQWFTDNASLKFGTNLLWYIQNMCDKNEIFEVVGKYTESGEQRFVEVNRRVDTAMMAKMYAEAQANEPMDTKGIGMTQLTPQQFIDQYLVMEEEEEKNIAAGGQVATEQILNNTQKGNYKVSCKGDITPFTRMQQQKFGAMLAEMGLLPDYMLLELFDFNASPDVLARLPKRIAEQQQAKQQEMQLQMQMEQMKGQGNIPAAPKQ